MAKQKQKQKKEVVIDYIPFQLKPDKNFKMHKQTKRILALSNFKTEEDRNAWKRAMINAQLHEESAKRSSLKREKEDVSS
jgi:hypothetical protein